MIERWWAAITCRIGGRCESYPASKDLLVQLNQRTRHIDAEASDIKRRRTNIDQMLVRKSGSDFLVDALTNKEAQQ